MYSGWLTGFLIMVSSILLASADALGLPCNQLEVVLTSESVDRERVGRLDRTPWLHCLRVVLITAEEPKHRNRFRSVTHWVNCIAVGCLMGQRLCIRIYDKQLLMTGSHRQGADHLEVLGERGLWKMVAPRLALNPGRQRVCPLVRGEYAISIHRIR